MGVLYTLKTTQEAWGGMRFEDARGNVHKLDNIFSYSETLNNEYIGRIIQMSSWNFSMSFMLYYVNFSICENK